MRVQPKPALFAKCSGLKIEKIPRIDNGFCLERQTEGWKALGDKHTQARIINGEAPLERIDSKDGSLRRETEHRFDVRPCLEVSLELTKERLKKIILEQIRRI